MASDITVNQLLAMQHEQSLGIQRQNAEAFAALNVQMNRVGTSILTQGAFANVSDFSEKGNLRSWLSEIEKSRVINGLSEKDTCQLAWAKSKGHVSQMLGRKLKENPEIKWDQVKSCLEKEFGDIIDKQQAFIQLTSIRQGREKNVSAYVERMLALANRAYGSGWRDDPTDVIEEQMVSIFMEGLKSHEVKMRIYRKQVREINEAIEIAKAEDLSKKRFPGTTANRQRHEEDMDIGHYRKQACYFCGGAHRQRDCQKRKNPVRNVRVVNGRDTRYSQERRKLEEEDRRYRRCYNCHEKGHFVAQCRMNSLN